MHEVMAAPENIILLLFVSLGVAVFAILGEAFQLVFFLRSSKCLWMFAPFCIYWIKIATALLCQQSQELTLMLMLMLLELELLFGLRFLG